MEAIGDAYYWRQRLTEDRLSAQQLADELKMSDGLISKLMPLTCLGPVVLKRVLAGDHPRRITLKNLLEAAKLLDWSEQAVYLGLE